MEDDYMRNKSGSRWCGHDHIGNRLAQLRPLSGADFSAAAQEEGDRMIHVTAD